MPRRKGQQNKITKSIKETLEKAWHLANDPKRNGKGVTWLEKQAWERPEVFAGLIGKIIPAQIQADLSINHELTINLGNAIAIANKRLEENGLIDITPQSNDIKDLAIENNQAEELVIDVAEAKPLKTKETV